MTHIFRFDKEYEGNADKNISLKDMVEAVEGSEYEIIEGVEIDDYDYPIRTIWIRNSNYGACYLEIPYFQYTGYEAPIEQFEIHCYDNGFDFTKMITETLKANFHFISGSHHHNMVVNNGFTDEEHEENLKVLCAWVKENGLKFSKRYNEYNV